MFGFDRLITPKIISVLYIITVALLLLAAFVQFVSGKGIGAAIGLVVSALFSRVFFECIMVSFKNNEYLRRIAESLEKDKTQS